MLVKYNIREIDTIIPTKCTITVEDFSGECFPCLYTPIFDDGDHVERKDSTLMKHIDGDKWQVVNRKTLKYFYYQ